MKPASSLFACAVVLACVATPALAQDQAQIARFGEGHGATIEQISTAGTNLAALHQGSDWYTGYGNTASLMQRSVDGSQIEVFQTVGGNQYQVSQYDGWNLTCRGHPGEVILAFFAPVFIRFYPRQSSRDSDARNLRASW